jgi:phosphate transport system permease protein
MTLEASPVVGARTTSKPSGTLGDSLFVGLTLLFAFLVLAIMGAIIISLVYGSLPTFERFGIAGFYTGSTWDPVREVFGGLPPIVGTLVSSAIALTIAIPISFGVAVFITEMAPSWLKRPVGTAIELLAAIPSIIYGMWGLFVFAPFVADHVQPFLTDKLGDLPVIGVLFHGPPIGISVFTAGVVLAVMVTPFIASIMRDVFEVVPAMLRESAYAVGATTWEVIWHIVLPYARAGVIGGIMLGLGRALGETMAVTFVIGNAHALHAALFEPGNSIASTIANEFAEADGELYTSALTSLGLMLLFIALVVLAISRILLNSLARRHGGGRI